MKRKKLQMLLVCILCSVCAIAQTDYYYYKGNKVPLTLNESKVCVSISKDCNETCERIRANATVFGNINDKTFDILVISRSDFEKLTTMDTWEEDVKSVVLTSCYFTENNEEICATPYLNVKLKEEQDKDLLTSYAKEYKLKIIGNSPLMPLWYILSLSPNNEKSSLQCANELYETGYFPESMADLASYDLYDDSTPVHSIASPNTQSILFDLQGRRLAGKPSRGIYIEGGKKWIRE